MTRRWLQSEGDEYRLTGTWRYTEGAALVDWILVAVCMPDNVDGYALIPSEAFESTPADHLGGLRGVGVYELSARDLSVPAHRTIGATELFGIGDTSSAVLPYWEFQVLAPLLGCAEGAFHNYTSSTRKRVGGTTNAAVARFTQVQQRLAEVSARIKAARLLYQHSMHLLMSRRVEGRVLTREEALELARDRSFIAGSVKRLYGISSDRWARSVLPSSILFSGNTATFTPWRPITQSDGATTWPSTASTNLAFHHLRRLPRRTSQLDSPLDSHAIMRPYPEFLS